jgi:hypothetical protein
VRQVCNVAYAAIVEPMTTDELKDFDRKLEGLPPASKGVEGLMAAFGMPHAGA